MAGKNLLVLSSKVRFQNMKEESKAASARVCVCIHLVVKLTENNEVKVKCRH